MMPEDEDGSTPEPDNEEEEHEPPSAAFIASILWLATGLGIFCAVLLANIILALLHG